MVKKVKSRKSSGEVSKQPRLVVETVSDEEYQEIIDEEKVDGDVEKIDELRLNRIDIESNIKEYKGIDNDIYDDKNKSIIKRILVGILTVIIVCLGWYFLRSRETINEENLSPAMIEEKEGNVVEEVVQLDRGEIVLDVMNGSGRVGLAAKTAEMFRNLGYEIGEIGNAERVTETELWMKKDIKDRLEVLLEDLSGELQVATIAGYLEEESEASARIILGE